MNKKYGCGSHSCYLQKPVGMGNNGPCGCFRGVDIPQRRLILGYINHLRKKIDDFEHRWEEVANAYPHLRDDWGDSAF